ncbi:MAG: alkaline phosphatase family protein [Terrimonas sp.]|nr:alkaline phosphatase family protein [Terrimonas sp.]
MKYRIVFPVFLLISLYSCSQSPKVSRPKLVVGIVVDQMRWDYLYRFNDRYSAGGFKRLLGDGFTCENTFIPYAQTVTAAGHTCVYTGSVPAIHGIMGNEWYDKSLGRSVYCTEDETVKTIGGSDKADPESPRNLWASTICDELKLATNFRSKVIGIAIKDRGGILPAGHAADAAYWYDTKSGNWVTSTYYREALPAWVTGFNNRKIVDSFYRLNWNTLYPLHSYQQSDRDDAAYEGKFGFEDKPVFPHQLSAMAGKSYSLITSTPYGNSMTLDFARKAVENEQMGRDDITDFLAVSISSTDYVGHQFGPNSIEIEDTYLRLDRDLASFFAFLDQKVGKGNYTVFLTADHGVAHNPGFLQEHKIPAQTLTASSSSIVKAVEEKFHVKNCILDAANYQFYLNDKAIDSAGADKEKIREFIVQTLNANPDVLIAFDTQKIAEVNLPERVREMFVNGFNTKRGGDIQVVLKPGYFFGGKTGSTHGSWYPYDAHIPLVWMGWGINKGKSNTEHYMTDIAPTLAALLHIQMPNGAIGRPIPELMK